MFSKLFKRSEPPAPPVRKQAASAERKPVRTPVIHERPAVPEAVEDHDESAWDLWEQSQFQLDSQMGGLAPSDSVKVRNANAPSPADADPFDLVGKNHR